MRAVRRASFGCHPKAGRRPLCANGRAGEGSSKLPDFLREQLEASLGTEYALGRELGGGGMSRVFVAEERRFDRRVVIKVLPRDLAAGISAERFQREIALAAQLQQANIVPVLAAGEVGAVTCSGAAPCGPDRCLGGHEALPYYSMPFVDGETLGARIARGPISVTEAVKILGDVARALATLAPHGARRTRCFARTTSAPVHRGT